MEILTRTIVKAEDVMLGNHYFGKVGTAVALLQGRRVLNIKKQNGWIELILDDVSSEKMKPSRKVVIGG